MSRRDILPILSIGFTNLWVLLPALLPFLLCHEMGRSGLGAASSASILEWRHKGHTNAYQYSHCSLQIPLMRNTLLLWVNKINDSYCSLTWWKQTGTLSIHQDYLLVCDLEEFTKSGLESWRHQVRMEGHLLKARLCAKGHMIVFAFRDFTFHLSELIRLQQAVNKDCLKSWKKCQRTLRLTLSREKS